MTWPRFVLVFVAWVVFVEVVALLVTRSGRAVGLSVPAMLLIDLGVAAILAAVADLAVRRWKRRFQASTRPPVSGEGGGGRDA